jgi:hypothetical protein
MKAAQCFVEYNKEELSLLNNLDLAEENQQNKLQRLTQGFWDTAAVVFMSNVKKRLRIAGEIHEAFLAKVQIVLEADIRACNQNSIWNGWHRYIVPYVLRHRSHLPINFVATLKKANEEKVIDISEILSYEIIDGIRTTDAYWHALKNPLNAIEPDPQPNNPFDYWLSDFVL